jgi:UDP-N-acetyl-D-mannosaminuronic acid transferase (WecB/TagA/CpsF family)
METILPEVRFQRILGVRFLVGNAQQAISQLSSAGGVVVVPGAPALKNLPHDEGYREALLGADFAIPDSSLMVMLWNLIHGDRIPKLSGLKYLRTLIIQSDFREPGASFWVMPTAVSLEHNRKWLNAHDVAVDDRDLYVAPIYGSVIDDAQLLRQLEERRPRHVVLGLGGGTQERLGFYLKRNLSYSPSIHCIGAAIAFLSGDQVKIPRWVDERGLGWLWRCISNPRRFGPRYWSARHLVPLMLRYSDRLPTPSAVASSSLRVQSSGAVHAAGFPDPQDAA